MARWSVFGSASPAGPCHPARACASGSASWEMPRRGNERRDEAVPLRALGRPGRARDHVAQRRVAPEPGSPRWLVAADRGCGDASRPPGDTRTTGTPRAVANASQLPRSRSPSGAWRSACCPGRVLTPLEGDEGVPGSGTVTDGEAERPPHGGGQSQHSRRTAGAPGGSEDQQRGPLETDGGHLADRRGFQDGRGRPSAGVDPDHAHQRHRGWNGWAAAGAGPAAVIAIASA